MKGKLADVCKRTSGSTEEALQNLAKATPMNARWLSSQASMVALDDATLGTPQWHASKLAQCMKIELDVCLLCSKKEVVDRTADAEATATPVCTPLPPSGVVSRWLADRGKLLCWM